MPEYKGDFGLHGTIYENTRIQRNPIIRNNKPLRYSHTFLIVLCKSCHLKSTLAYQLKPS